MFAQKSFRKANVLVGKLLWIRGLGAIVLAGFEQVWAVEWAVQCHLALASAAEWADLAAGGGTVPSRTTGFANFAEHSGSTGSIICNGWRECLLRVLAMKHKLRSL